MVTDTQTPQSNLTKITHEELAQHNKSNDAWIGISGKVYDITNWMSSHPGGVEPLILFAGRESTEMFESYHKMSTVNYLGTEKVPCVGELVSYRYPTYTGKSEYYPTLRARVEKKFKEAGVSDVRNLSPFVIYNTIFISIGMAISYYISMYTSYSFTTKFIFAILSGLFHHFAMVHLLHDVSHFCYSRLPWVWRIGGFLGDATTGHSMYVWAHRHVVAHHFYTNVSGVDPDIGIYKASPHKPLEGLNYRTKIAIVPTWFQPFLYFFVCAQMQIDDLFSYARGSMENTPINDQTFLRNLEFIAGKLVFYGHRVILPIYLGQGIFATLYYFTVAEAVAGFLFGYFSQVTHVSDEVVWPSESPIPRDWAELQVETAVDFCHDSFFWTYMSGYLNYQVVHHLFPSVAPHHYPEILDIIKETSNEYKLKYIIYPTLTATVQHHFAHLAPFQKYRERYASKIQKEGVKEMHIIDKADMWIRNLFSGKDATKKAQ